MPRESSSMRNYLLRKVDESTRATLAFQSRRNRYLDLTFRLSTYMGDTNFYVIFIPFLYWVVVPLKIGVDAKFVYVFSSMLFFMALIAGVIKDIMNSPRPPRDKIWRLKDEHDNGFPSSHSQNAMGLSLYVAYTFWDQFGDYRYIIGALLVMYTTLVAMSRFYNGVHSLPDIFAGLFAGVVFGYFFSFETIQEASIDWRGAALAFVIAITHPQPPTVTNSRAWSLALLIVGIVIVTNEQVLSMSRVVTSAVHNQQWLQSAVGLLTMGSTCGLSLGMIVLVRCVVAFTVFYIWFWIATAFANTMVVLRAWLPTLVTDRFHAVRRRVALDTYIYEKLNEIEEKFLSAELHRTRNRPFLALCIPVGVFLLIPSVLDGLTALQPCDTGPVPQPSI